MLFFFGREVAHAYPYPLVIERSSGKWPIEFGDVPI
jgi:hypothetical protein